MPQPKVNKGEVETPLGVGLKLLSHRSYSRKHLRERLIKYGFDENSIETALDRLNGWGYLNDRDYAISRIILLQQHLKSRAFVEMDLLAQGIQAELVTELIKQHYPEEQEIKIALKFLEKRVAKKHSSVKKWASLTRAGFSENTIRYCLPEIST